MNKNIVFTRDFHFSLGFRTQFQAGKDLGLNNLSRNETSRVQTHKILKTL